MDMTKKGGHPIYFIERRDITKQNLSLNDGIQAASKFLKNNQFDHMEVFESTQYDHIGVFSFVVNEEGVRIYPETIKLKVALDNGQIIGFTAQDYMKNTENRKIPKPKLTMAEAKGSINPKLKVMEDRLAIISNELGKEVLCYEFLGTLGKDTYRIFINANDGKEEKCRKNCKTRNLYITMYYEESYLAFLIFFW